MWDQPEVHEVYRRWRKILDEYDGDRMAVAEACAGTPEAMARYIREDELQQTFNFTWLEAPWSAAAFRKVVVDTFDSVGLVGGTPTWVLSNHDVVRETTRYGGGEPGSRPGPGRGADDDGAARVGLRLPGRGARPRAGRRAAGAAAGPGVLPRRRARRPRRLPGADAVVGHRGAVRLRPGRGPAVAAAARRLGGPHGRGAARRRRARR